MKELERRIPSEKKSQRKTTEVGVCLRECNKASFRENKNKEGGEDMWNRETVFF